MAASIERREGPGLTEEEKDALMNVMERAKEFDRANNTKSIVMSLEGQLYKWTNPLKGWQPRWFYVDHDQGVLHYYTSEDRRMLPPRASLHLWGAVVSPSDEDSQSFSVQGANNETYRLKAADAKDRQYWVSRLRQEVEHANSLAVGSKEVSQNTVQSTSSLLASPQGTSTNLQSPDDTVGSPNHNTSGTTPARKISKRSQLSAPLTLSITKLKRRDRDRHTAVGKEAPDAVTSLTSFQEDVEQFPGGDTMLDSLMAMQSLHEQLNQQLEMAEEDIGTLPYDKNVLLLKATSQAAVQSVQDCLAMMNLQMGRHSRRESPLHTFSQTLPLATGGARKKRHHRIKRPISMIDTSEKAKKKVEDELSDDDSILRSLSVSEVRGNRQKTASQKISKEAP